MKKFFAACGLVMVITGASSVYAKDANVVVNGKEIDTEAVILEDRVLVPLRGVYEELGFNVTWYPEEKNAEFVKGSRNMVLYGDFKSIKIDGEDYSPEIPHRIINDRLYLPLRFTSEAFGLDVDWDGQTKTAYINGDVADTSAVVPVNYDLSTNSFANNLNAKMPTDKNYMFSPLSIKMALALAANGAEGKTRDQIIEAANLGDINNFNTYANGIISKYKNNKNVQLDIANSLWLNTDKAGDVTFKASYTDKMQKYYNAEVSDVDYSNAVNKINSWCKEKTNGKIPSIIEDSDFLAALVNAIYFKGDWAVPFDKNSTYKDTFTERGGKEASIDFMHNTDDFRYYEDNDVQIVEMPYKGGDIAMYAVLSNDKRIDITNYLDKMSYEEVAITMPKFKIEYSQTLDDTLKSFGINDAFLEDAADFNSMFERVGDENFYIDTVLHKTYIEVDEVGTEAAAVTAIMMDGTAAIGEPKIIKHFIADKPFSYYIIDNNTDEILFMGEYAYAE